ncbi:MAG TPA: fumarylacetoacetate hydrolase family protein [Streptosporangiaceae bacterium]|nr:fumarylacetoacetate hydrolase family protein [Streptosporangiaceae bacterium]
MQIIRYAGPAGVRAGIRDAGGTIRGLGIPSLASLLALPAEEIRAVTERTGPAEDGELRLLPPVDDLTEVWAAGVTYQRSSSARQEESDVADVYARVYGAERPELFLKSPAWRVCGPGEPVGIRPDSAISVPEPELAVVCNAAGQIIGATICNDMSSRDIEGQNPLYLPQAKIYTGACALGPGIVPAWELADLQALDISVTVRRDGAAAWQAAGSTRQLHRSLTDLTGYLFRHASFPHGVVLSTGTGLVPELDFTLAPGDEIVIRIAGLGELANVVRPATDQWFSWLTPEPGRRPPG